MQKSHANTAPSLLPMPSYPPPTSFVPSILTLLKSCKSRIQLHQVHARIIQIGLEQDHFLISNLISLCHSLSAPLSYSTSIFNQISKPNTFLWNTLLKGYSQKSRYVDIFSLFVRMIREQGVPDQYTFPLVIKACSSELNLRQGKSIHGFVFKSGVDDAVFVGSSLVDLYGKCDMASARFLFDEATYKDIVVWSALVSGYAQNGQPNEAVKIYIEMTSRNVKPDKFTIVSLMSACSQLGSLELAKTVDSILSRSEIDVRQPYVTAALIDMNAKCGNMDRAEKLFEELPNRDLITYSSMIQGFSMHGQGKLAVNLFNRMISEGELVANQILEFEPQNAGNYVLLSNIYAAAGRWFDVSLVRNKMKERGVRKIPGRSWI
ncbi:hypothetical protein Q3G72_022308 [Acer saccharum]|nr:hypothetical protein Q3G72_022308 [Acer saccharum]